MSELQRSLPESVVNPVTGELLLLEDPAAVAIYLDEVRQLEDKLRFVKRILGERLAEESRVQGTQVLHMPGVVVTLTRKKEIEWDMPKLRELKALGLPEQRFNELVRQTIETKVLANEAKKIAAANPAYREVIEAARSDREGEPYVSKIERSAS